MPRILFIDAYDSFSNNIITLLRAELEATVQVIRIDDARFTLNHDAFVAYLQTFDAVVAGPGPGHPARNEDIGLIARLWTLNESQRIPVLGICLGFQSLCLAAGAKVLRLREPRHGRIAKLRCAQRDVFDGIGEVVVTRYHSLHVLLDDYVPHEQSLWNSGPTCPDLEPLAWACGDEENGPVLMAVRWRNRPFWGVQYHPESVCTNASGGILVRNWWKEALVWRTERYNHVSVNPLADGTPSTLSWASGPATPQNEVDGTNPFTETKSPGSSHPHTVSWTSWTLQDGIEVVEIVDAIRAVERVEPILLESGVRNGAPLNAETGRFSIVGVPSVRPTEFKYYAASELLEQSTIDGEVQTQRLGIQENFGVLQEFMARHRALDGPANLPFWGGLMGFIGYEAGLLTIDVPPHGTDPNRPDLWFVFVERSIIIDHIENKIYVLSIRKDDQAWLNSTKVCIVKIQAKSDLRQHTAVLEPAILQQPQEVDYCDAVRACQDHLRAGSSYELCLTNQTQIRNDETAWTIYSTLRKANPAPFGCSIRLDGRTRSDSLDIAGSSPERFLSWSREGLCQFRPIKGTVKKGPTTTRADADAILNSEKERAENLMIVDLIRHDLSGVASVENVHVPKLMVVEEYETVYQLVSVIEGTITTDPAEAGVAVLARSLPPGSMTGAPKKRSCELLCELERGQPRGLYSGVLGYLDVGGGGDFSVVIRTAFKWDGEGCWRIGAGGAVTALSEPHAEWEEMLAKRERILDVLAR